MLDQTPLVEERWQEQYIIPRVSRLEVTQGIYTMDELHKVGCTGEESCVEKQL